MSSDTAPHEQHLGALIRALWQQLRDRAYARVRASGYDDLQPAHLQVFRLPSPDGQRPSELAARMQISKQSVNDLLGHLERRGYLTREPDPADGRSRVLRLTARGRELEAQVVGEALATEAMVAEMLGEARYRDFRATLEELLRHG